MKPRWARPVTPKPEPPSRHCHLTTYDLHRLDVACTALRSFYREHNGGIYLVGSSELRRDYRDVDVRLILPDLEFDKLFGHSEKLWSAFCYAVSGQLRADTGLPIDFQVQRRSEANARFHGPRNGLGHVASGAREFAGLGDATRFGEDPARIESSE